MPSSEASGAGSSSTGGGVDGGVVGGDAGSPDSAVSADTGGDGTAGGDLKSGGLCGGDANADRDGDDAIGCGDGGGGDAIGCGAGGGIGGGTAEVGVIVGTACDLDRRLPLRFTRREPLLLLGLAKSPPLGIVGAPPASACTTSAPS